MSQTTSRTRGRRHVPVPTPSARLGRRGAEPLLLIHPFMCDQDVWADVMPALAADFDVLAVTLPGHHGGPHLPRREVGVEAFADGVERLLDEVGWPTCHVAGNSIGGWLSFELARRGRARSVTAIAPAGGWTRLSLAQLSVGAKFLAVAPLAVLGHVTGDLGRRLRPAVRLALRIVSADPAEVSPQRAEGFVRAASNCSAFLPYVWSDLRRGGVTGLETIDVPIRLVLCEDDWLLPPQRYAALFLDRLPDADVVRLDGVGHVPMLDDPARVAEVIAEHALAHAGGGDHAETA